MKVSATPFPQEDVHILLYRIMTTCVYITWQKGIMVADGIKVTNQLTLRWGNYPALSLWAQCYHKYPYKCRREEEA